MDTWQMLSLVLDVVTIFLTVEMFLARPRVGGELGKGMRILVMGFLVLGIAFFAETTLFVILHISREIIEVIHRLLVGLGFAVIIAGFNMMRRTFK